MSDVFSIILVYQCYLKIMLKTHSNFGFTLIELSIVLVIIGLIIGGVLVGQDLIKAAQLRKIMSEIENYKTSAITFRLKYNCYPGDCWNATQFGFASNGNGNNQIGVLDMVPEENEIVYAWQHLSAAGLVAGSYSGSFTGAQPNMVANTDFPESRYQAKVGYYFVYAGYIAASSFFQAGSYDNVIILAKEQPSIFPSLGFMSPHDSQQLDIKYDDGKPGLGVITNNSLDWGNCVTSYDPVAAMYNAGYINNPECFLIFRAGF